MSPIDVLEVLRFLIVVAQSAYALHDSDRYQRSVTSSL